MVISSNALSLSLLYHDMNKVLNHNIRLIQYLMRSDEPAGTNFKRVRIDFTNLALITKSAKPGDIQVNFDHASAGNPPPGKP